MRHKIVLAVLILTICALCFINLVIEAELLALVLSLIVSISALGVVRLFSKARLFKLRNTFIYLQSNFKVFLIPTQIICEVKHKFNAIIIKTKKGNFFVLNLHEKNNHYFKILKAFEL